MFNFFKKKKQEEKKEEPKSNVVKVQLIGCDDERGNLYYDEEQDMFYDWIIPYDPLLPSVSLLWHKQNVFEKHILVCCDKFYPNIELDDCTFDFKDDIRYLKVLDQDVIKEKFIKGVCQNNKILLENGMINIKEILLREHKFHFLSWVCRNYKCWEVNGKYTLAQIFNGLPKETKDDYIRNCLRNIEYRMWT